MRQWASIERVWAAEAQPWHWKSDTAASVYTNRNSNMDIKQLSKSKYLKTADVPEPVIVTIADIDMANVAKEGERRDERLVVTFKEFDKGMVFNATNMKRAAKAFGSDETDDWIGKKLVLYTDEEVEYAGEVVGGLRVRAKKKPQRDPEDDPDPRYKGATPSKRSESIADMKDDIPF